MEGGSALDAGTEIPLQPVVKNLARQAVPCSPRYMGSGDPPVACGGPHAGAGGYPEEAVTLWEAHTGAGSLQNHWSY